MGLVASSAVAIGMVLASVPWDGVVAGPAVEAPTPQQPAPQQVVGLSQGAQGTGVRAVQNALMRAGIAVPGGADGVFGPVTRAALMSFQRREGLGASGKVDQGTAVALGVASTPAPASPAPAASDSGGLVGLGVGSRGNGVRTIQQALHDAGVYVAGGIDGIYGGGTKTAVSNYQRWNGLTVTGGVTAAVVKALGLSGGTPPAASATGGEPQGATANAYVGLSVGARGDLVKKLQSALIAKGVPVSGGADGVFGPATKAALSQFQRANGAAATGTVSEADASRLGLAGRAVREPAAAAGANPYVGLAIGAGGAKVKTLQTALMAAGITVRGGADGAFGAATKSALVSYQRAHGLSASGIVDAATAAKLGLGTPAAAPAPTPTSGGSSNGYVGLAQGSRGDKVKELQQALLETGLTVRGGADGVFGSATRSALVIFQRVNGIGQTGVLTATGARILGLGSSSGPVGIAGVAGYPSFGEHSSRVATLQKALMNAGISVPGGADGKFGSSTAGAVMNLQRRHGLSVTGKVDQRTAAKLGLAPSAAPAPVSSVNISFKVFPVQGRCYFGDTWHAPRGGGRTHLGIDIIAKEGNLLYAAVDGEVSKQYWDQPGSRAGNGLRLRQPDGTYFTYLHMLDFAPGLEVGTKVKAGEVIGFVGNTGSSATAHLHLEIHPLGGAAINPYPIAKAADACSVTAPRS
ncbi:MAG: peptidoglycan-binding protein [Acidimicrobiia bacterium]|nr:peptidoglycan-binding protein [Acidimicrobiia bacterium]